jgi:RnfABCDGE-type electron transport complex D subunit
MAAVGIAVGIIIGKEIFGGTGKNIFNPAIVGRTFIAITFPVQMASQWVPPFKGGLGGFVHWSQPMDAITTATPLGNFKNGMPDSILDMFIGATSGSLGETSALLIIAGGLFLMFTKVANWRLPVATIVSSMVIAYLMHLSNPEAFASPLYHLVGGGLLFGAFFMVTDPVAAPFSSAGKWVYGILIGIVVMVIRNLSGFTEGMMFSILLMNMFAPMIDDIVLGFKYGRGA